MNAPPPPSKGRPRWRRVFGGIGVIVFLAVPCLIAAVVVAVGGNYVLRSDPVAAGRAPGTLTFDAARQRYTIALAAETDGIFFDGLTRTERRARFRVRPGEESEARCAVTHPDGSRTDIRGDRQGSATTVGSVYATVGKFTGKGGRADRRRLSLRPGEGPARHDH